MANYVTLEEANTYFDSYEIENTWDSYTDAQKQRAINLANKQIERMPFHGRKLEDYQVEQFPRKYLKEGIYYYWNRNESGEDVVPEDIKDSVCLQAKFLLVYNESARLKAQREGVTSLSVGSTSESYDLNKPITQNSICQESLELLNKYLLRYQ